MPYGDNCSPRRTEPIPSAISRVRSGSRPLQRPAALIPQPSPCMIPWCCWSRSGCAATGFGVCAEDSKDNSVRRRTCWPRVSPYGG
jgi:hypothetical protein